jgi:hypothetical protein
MKRALFAVGGPLGWRRRMHNTLRLLQPIPLLQPTALLQPIPRLHAIPAAGRAMAMATAQGPTRTP